VNGWYGEPVDVTVTGPDGASLAYSIDGGPWTPYEGPVPVATSGAHVFRARSTIGGTVAEAVTVVAIDLDGPVITSPLDGAVIRKGVAPPEPWFACLDAGTPTPVCSGPTTLNTSTSGPHSFTVTATDAHGNQTQRTFEYSVFDGFFAPVKNPPALNAVKAGATQPFKFMVFGPTGAAVTSTQGIGLAWVTIDCATKAPVVPDPFGPTADGDFRRDAKAKQLHFNAKTGSAWAGSCRWLVVTFPGGSTVEALVRFT
jgi:hypothetical protein